MKESASGCKHTANEWPGQMRRWQSRPPAARRRRPNTSRLRMNNNRIRHYIIMYIRLHGQAYTQIRYSVRIILLYTHTHRAKCIIRTSVRVRIHRVYNAYTVYRASSCSVSPYRPSARPTRANTTLIREIYERPPLVSTPRSVWPSRNRVNNTRTRYT